ncbi:hypothetical protein BDV24DRAFT_170634 [Aspergillus arachidicola]|uniref:Uncharacterized protein n=1 Tax=Aspergillus arachidicola TaxID=656916 RepID=A0A5N6XLD7_9EURO|nr:hypothetical protein BDV24DRAFT_170634 [Aspergillus arachidicola]
MALGDEVCEGTKYYCANWFNKLGNKYQSPEDCEAAREPRPSTAKPEASSSPVSQGTLGSEKKQPWREPNNSIAACGNPLFAGNTQKKDEVCLGTAKWCREEQQIKKYGSEKECEASREHRQRTPSANKLPWIQGDLYTSGCYDRNVNCERNSLTEQWLGTKRFCNEFFNVGDTPYETKDACFADRQPRPHKN